MPRKPKHQPLPTALHRALPAFEQAARVNRRTTAVPTPQKPLGKTQPPTPKPTVFSS